MSAIGTYFSNENVSFISEILEGLYNRRKEAQAEMKVWKQKLEGCAPEEKKSIEAMISKLNGKQHNSKIKMNALYGAMANEGFRFFHPDMAESITATGQLIIRWAGDSLNIFMNKKFGTEGIDYIVYSDTDSVYLNLEPLIRKYSKPEWGDEEKAAYAAKVGEQVILPYLEKKIEDLGGILNAKKPDKIKFKMEKVCRNSIFSAKKKYVLLVPIEEGITYDTPKVKVTGLESVRSSTPNKVKDYIKQSFKTIMTENETAIQDYIEKTRKEFKSLGFEEIAFPRGVSDLDAYRDKSNIYKKGTPIHVRASLLYNQYLEKTGLDKKYEKIYNGDKIKFCYLKVPNPLGENVIASKGDKLPPEFGLEKYLDYDEQFMKTFLGPIENILDSIGWTSEPISNLEDFFA
jgi:DNA polymerase elongation subunit (family B)